MIISEFDDQLRFALPQNRRFYWAVAYEKTVVDLRVRGGARSAPGVIKFESSRIRGLNLDQDSDRVFWVNFVLLGYGNFSVAQARYLLLGRLYVQGINLRATKLDSLLSHLSDSTNQFSVQMNNEGELLDFRASPLFEQFSLDGNAHQLLQVAAELSVQNFGEKNRRRGGY